jgi:hypothetical protein
MFENLLVKVCGKERTERIVPFRSNRGVCSSGGQELTERQQGRGNSGL